MDSPFAPTYTLARPAVLPPAAWEAREAELPQDEATVIQQALQEAVASPEPLDVHLYRKIGSPFLGLAFKPGTGSTVKIWEH